MIRFFRPRLTAAVTALALAVTTLAPAPASAMNDNERAMLGIILGIGAIAALSDQGEAQRIRQRHYMPPPPPPRHRDFRRHDHRRADACVVRIERDRRGNRVEVYSPACNDDRSSRRGGRDFSRGGQDFPYRH